MRDVEDLTAELPHRSSGDSRLPTPRGTEQKAILRLEAILDGCERIRNFVHLAVPANDLVWEMRIVENRPVSNHLLYSADTNGEVISRTLLVPNASDSDYTRC